MSSSETASSTSVRGLPPVPVREAPEPFGTEVEVVVELGGETSFLQFAANDAEVLWAGDDVHATFTEAERAAAEACCNVAPGAATSADLLTRLQASLEPDELPELLTLIGLPTGMARMLHSTDFIEEPCAAQ